MGAMVNNLEVSPIKLRQKNVSSQVLSLFNYLFYIHFLNLSYLYIYINFNFLARGEERRIGKTKGGQGKI